MKRFLIKIASVSLALVVLFATSSFTVDMHYCCNKLVDMAILSKAKPCKGENQKIESPSKKCSLGQKDCCSNSTFVKNADDNLKLSQFEFRAENFVFLQTFIFTYVNIFEGLELEVVSFVNYHPPFLEKDILVLHETFLL